MRYFIIEHPTRGCFTDLDFDCVTGAPKPHFSWSCLRGDERVEKFFHPGQAKRRLAKLPPGLARECVVLAAPVGREVEWKRVDVG